MPESAVCERAGVCSASVGAGSAMVDGAEAIDDCVASSRERMLLEGSNGENTCGIA